MKDYEDIAIQQLIDSMSIAKDTYNLQLVSLDSFADALGYYRSPVDNKYINSKSKGQPIVSFNTMVNLHNSQWYYDIDQKVYVPEPYFWRAKKYVFKLDPYSYRKADSRRIIYKVKLQANRFGVIKTQSDVVKFTSEFYYEYFLED